LDDSSNCISYRYWNCYCKKVLKNLLNEGHKTFAFKENRNEINPHYFRCVENDHGIILKEYSKTFCKLELEKNILPELDHQVELSDDSCYIYKGVIIPKTK